MNAEINFTSLNTELSLCLACNLDAIRDRWESFWFGVVRVVVSPLKTKEASFGHELRPNYTQDPKTAPC